MTSKQISEQKRLDRPDREKTEDIWMVIFEIIEANVHQWQERPIGKMPRVMTSVNTEKMREQLVIFFKAQLALPLDIKEPKQRYEAILKQAVRDSADNKDIDLPETLYEIFCSIQNQAIRNHEQKRLDRPELREKIAKIIANNQFKLFSTLDKYFWDGLTDKQRKPFLKIADQILVIPDTEEAYYYSMP